MDVNGRRDPSSLRSVGMTKMANRCVRHLNVYLLNNTRLFYLLSH